jgi:dTDP-4-dehydrorhamnose 3,5-epimerase
MMTKHLVGRKHQQSVTPDWRFVNAGAIEGVSIKEVAHVPVDTGYVTELVRAEWLGENARIDQVFQRVLDPGAISAWHRHTDTTDRLFCTHGQILLVLYDGRPDSRTHGTISEHRIGTLRPTLVIVPPDVWHGVKNVGREPAVVINIVDRAYNYADPDHWTISAGDDSGIPYRFA